MPDEALRLERPATHRVGSGLAVADLLSGPSPATPSRRPSYEEANVAEEAGPSKVSTIHTRQDAPVTPSKQVSTSNTQPVTPEAASEGLTYQYPPVQQVLEGRENMWVLDTQSTLSRYLTPVSPLLSQRVPSTHKRTTETFADVWGRRKGGPQTH